MVQQIGGMTVKTLSNLPVNQEEILGEKPYKYHFLPFSGPTSYLLKKDTFYCLHLPTSQEGTEGKIASLRLRAHSTLLHKQEENQWLQLHGSGTLLIAEQKVDPGYPAVQKIYSESEVKKVSKPWGYELWFTGEPPFVFAFKKIFVTQGTKTSLQFHEKKRETNLLFEGKALLHYNPDSEVPAQEFNPAHARTHALLPLMVVDIFPRYVHRLEAQTDITLYEISTPEVDDVIRISDEKGRPSGRILSEHT